MNPFAHQNTVTHVAGKPLSPMPPKIESNSTSPLAARPIENLEALMGNTPGWLLHSGISIISLFILLLFMLGWLVRYPDVVQARITLTTAQPPIRIMAKLTGRLENLSVQNEEFVKKGQLLGVFENTAHVEDIYRLEQILLVAQSNSGNSLDTHDSLQLGALQSSWSKLCQMSQDLSYFETNTGISARVSNLKAQIHKIENLKSALSQQMKTLKQEVLISEKVLTRSQTLFSQRVISLEELEKVSSQHLQYTRQLDVLQTQIINNEIQQKQLEGQVQEILQSFKDNNNIKTTNIAAEVTSLLAAVQEWKQTYLIEAPIEGKAVLSRIWTAKQPFNAGEEVLTIVPLESNQAHHIIGKAIVPMIGAGKVKPDQTVQIRLDGYNYQEYGAVEAQVNNISLVPQEDNYLLEVNINPKLTTTYNKNLLFKQEMTGTAHIITEDRSLIERILDKFLNIWKNSN